MWPFHIAISNPASFSLLCDIASIFKPLKENLAFVSLVRTLTAPILAKAGSTSMRVSDVEQCNQSTKGGRHIVLNAIARPHWYFI